MNRVRRAEGAPAIAKSNHRPDNFDPVSWLIAWALGYSSPILPSIRARNGSQTKFSDSHALRLGCNRKNCTACTSRKGRGHPFAVTIDALVGACCPPIQGWCLHDESHFLRALGTKHHPGFSKDRLVRLVMLHRHDDSPSVGKRLGPMAETRLYKIAHCQSFVI